MNRIIGHCSQEDLASIRRRLDALKKHEVIDMDDLSFRERLALKFARKAVTRRLPLELLKVIRQVTFFGQYDQVYSMDVEFFKDFRLAPEVAKFRQLWRVC